MYLFPCNRAERIQRKEWSDFISVLTFGLHWCTDIGFSKRTSKIFTPCCSRCVVLSWVPTFVNTSITHLSATNGGNVFLFTVIVLKNVIPNKKKRTNQAEYVCTLTCVSVACDHCSSTEAVHFLVSSTVLYTVQWLFMTFSVLLINKYLLLILCNPINYVFKYINSM